MTTLIETIEADLKAAWGVVESTVVGTAENVVTIAEADALVVWNDFRAIVTAALPTEYSALKVFILQALTDVTNGDLADVETAVLNLAKESESWVAGVGSATLQAIIAVVKASVEKVETTV